MKYLKLIVFIFLTSIAISPIYAADDRVDVSSFISSFPNLKITTLNGFVSSFLPYALTFAGLILFAMLIMGGFTMMTAGTDAKAADAGKTRVTQAVIGFVIIFAAYWIAQIVEIVLGVNILK